MSTSTAIAAGTYSLDTDRSAIGISHKTMWGMATVTGTFTPKAGKAEVHDDGSATGTITVDAASVNTANAKRDTHLRSDDFFDVENYPTITFAVHNATLGSDGKTVTVDGQLTVHGISRPQALTATVAEATAEAVTLSANFAVDRTDFGLSWNQMGMLRGPATMTATLRFTRS